MKLTRIVTLHISGENEQVLNTYAEELADLMDEAMVSRETAKEVPVGVIYEGVDIIDPDKPDESSTQDLEVVT